MLLLSPTLATIRYFESCRHPSPSFFFLADFQPPQVDAGTGIQLPPQLDGAGTIFAPLKEGLNPDFTNVFRDGVDAYLAGQWSQARLCLEKATALKGGYDGPSKILLRVMQSKEFIAPDTWKGYRELTSKT